MSYLEKIWCAGEEDVGPGSYDVKDNGVIKPAKSFGLKINRPAHTDGPGPAQKSMRDSSPGEPCRKCECGRAATVKSRHTPNKYSGFRNLNRVEKPPRDFPTVPLLG
ncbi:hypothetical protein ElyMa_002868000 [Elysia marginata]|uniref:Uncharacterized protein n=1 Tax=Elysia marginata TaxID=1093978 RepID=A0AAV4HXZ8_9GAST|nr:hypothetical protein ElyMa_002868000 [Elysia marginata]